MKSLQEALQYCAIVALIAGGIWYTRDPAGEHSILSYFQVGAAGSAAIPLKCGNHVSWSEDG